MNDKETKENAEKADFLRIKIPLLWIFKQQYESRKDKRNNVSWIVAYIVYVWVYQWQLNTKVGFGKIRKKDVYDHIEKTFPFSKPNAIVGALIQTDFCAWGYSQYKGKRVVCLRCTYLNKKLGINNHAEYEESANIGIVAESNEKVRKATTIQKESIEPLSYPYNNWVLDSVYSCGNGLISVNGHIMSDKNGEYWDFDKRCRMYIPNNEYLDPRNCGVDNNAPPRPTPTAIYDWDIRAWVENGKMYDGEKWIEIEVKEEELPF